MSTIHPVSLHPKSPTRVSPIAQTKNSSPLTSLQDPEAKKGTVYYQAPPSKQARSQSGGYGNNATLDDYKPSYYKHIDGTWYKIENDGDSLRKVPQPSLGEQHQLLSRAAYHALQGQRSNTQQPKPQQPSNTRSLPPQGQQASSQAQGSSSPYSLPATYFSEKSSSGMKTQAALLEQSQHTISSGGIPKILSTLLLPFGTLSLGGEILYGTLKTKGKNTGAKEKYQALTEETKQNNGGKFKDPSPLSTKEAATALPFLELNEFSYYGQAFAPKGYTKLPIDEIDGIKLDQSNGLDAFIYQNDANGDMVLVFRGSEDTQDWVTNLKASRGEVTPQHRAAMAIAEKFKDRYKDHNPTISGHSLGAGLAQAAGIATGLKTIVFNSAGINEATYNEAVKKAGGEALAQENINSITHYNMQGDPISDPARRQDEYSFTLHAKENLTHNKKYGKQVWLDNKGIQSTRAGEDFHDMHHSTTVVGDALREAAGMTDTTNDDIQRAVASGDKEKLDEYFTSGSFIPSGKTRNTSYTIYNNFEEFKKAQNELNASSRDEYDLYNSLYLNEEILLFKDGTFINVEKESEDSEELTMSLHRPDNLTLYSKEYDTSTSTGKETWYNNYGPEWRSGYQAPEGLF